MNAIPYLILLCYKIRCRPLGIVATVFICVHLKQELEHGLKQAGSL